MLVPWCKMYNVLGDATTVHQGYQMARPLQAGACGPQAQRETRPVGQYASGSAKRRPCGLRQPVPMSPISCFSTSSGSEQCCPNLLAQDRVKVVLGPSVLIFA